MHRRHFLGIAAGAGATLALSPNLLRAAQQPGGKLLQRAIPSTGEMLPVISFGARTVGGAALSSQPADVAAIKAVLKTFLDHGGKVVDVLHGGPPGEQSARTAADELGIQDEFFWTTPVAGGPPGGGGTPPKADLAAVKAQIEARLATLEVSRIELAMLGAGTAAADPTYLAALRELKKEGRVRYIGVHDLLLPPPAPATEQLERILRDEDIDFVATDYSVGDRRVEQTLLPLAQERKIGFMAYFPFNRGRIFQRVGSTPLPEWAAEFDAETWAQFFLKYVVSHPAVTLAREGTTNPSHMLDNIGGGIGRLPDEATRKRMAEFVDSLPTPQPVPPKGVVLSAAVLDRYVGEYETPAGGILTFRRDGATLFVKPPGNNPEAPLTARSEIRFRDPQGKIFEFHVDSQGEVTGAFLEQNAPQPLELVRK
jgi:aryl-alcohol dehydrogenase-like predicted oxidoreductase